MPSALNDNATFFKYAEEGYRKVSELEKALKERKQLPLGGKASKIGEGYILNKDNTQQNDKAAAAAYDSNTNAMEQRLEDEIENTKLNEARDKTARANLTAGMDAATKAGDKIQKNKKK